MELPLLKLEKRVLATLTDEKMTSLLGRRPKGFVPCRLHGVVSFVLDTGDRGVTVPRQSVSAGDHRNHPTVACSSRPIRDRHLSRCELRPFHMAQVKVPVLVVPQLKLFTSRTASTVNEPRPKRALATDTPPFVVLSTLVFSVLSCAWTTIE